MTHLNIWVMNLSFSSYLQQIIWAMELFGAIFWMPKPVAGLTFCLDSALVLLIQNDSWYQKLQTLANNFYYKAILCIRSTDTSVEIATVWQSICKKIGYMYLESNKNLLNSLLKLIKNACSEKMMHFDIF